MLSSPALPGTLLQNHRGFPSAGREGVAGHGAQVPAEVQPGPGAAAGVHAGVLDVSGCCASGDELSTSLSYIMCYILVKRNVGKLTWPIKKIL